MALKWPAVYPIEVQASEESKRYLSTKRDKLGHLLKLCDDLPSGCAVGKS